MSQRTGKPALTSNAGLVSTGQSGQLIFCPKRQAPISVVLDFKHSIARFFFEKEILDFHRISLNIWFKKKKKTLKCCEGQTKHPVGLKLACVSIVNSAVDGMA